MSDHQRGRDSIKAALGIAESLLTQAHLTSVTSYPDFQLMMRLLRAGVDYLDADQDPVRLVVVLQDSDVDNCPASVLASSSPVAGCLVDRRSVARQRVQPLASDGKMDLMTVHQAAMDEVAEYIQHDHTMVATVNQFLRYE